MTWTPVGEALSRTVPGTTRTVEPQVFAWKGDRDAVIGHPDATKVYAQYVKVTVPLQRFIFIDELEVYGLNERTEGAVELP